MRARLFVLVGILLLLSFSVAAQEATEAEIENDEGGPVIITGQADYTFPAFRAFFYEPFVMMRDAAFVIDRDYDFIDAETSQVFGKVIGDAFTPPFDYQISLPIQPLAELRDVDNDSSRDTGVMIFGVQIAQNMIGDPFQQERDFISGLLSSMRFSEDPGEEIELIGGKLIVFAPEEGQGFPSGFGEDGFVFTEDDPIVIIPQGYTVVDLNTDPFTFDRSQEAFVELFEPEQVEANDFTNLSYTESFDAMIELFRNEYAFTDYKGLDWDALSEEFRPRVERAELANDANAFREVIRDFAWSIPDGHVSAPITNAEFQEAVEGGIGMSIRELDDGRVIVHYLLPDAPAQAAGIQLRAEILEIDGVPISEAIENTQAWSAPFSTQDFRRLQQLRYVIRFPMSKGDVTISYRNPGESDAAEAVLPLVSERDSFNYSSFTQGLTGLELPVEFEILDNGYGYIKIFSFSDDLPLTFRLWERALDTMNAANVPGLILDMRQNGGGSAYMADQLPAYFFDEVKNLGYTAVFNEEVNTFYYDPDLPSEFVLPPAEKRFSGPVAVLIHPFCQSACESFAYNMSLDGRAAIVGQYTTSGLGGSVVPVFLPDGVRTSITNGRSLDANGAIHIESKGVAPTVRVPVTEDTLFSEGDPVLETAIAHLEGVNTVPITETGAIAIGDTITGQLVEGERMRYTMEVPEDVVLDFVVQGTQTDLDTYLRIYVQGNEDAVLENDDDPQARTGLNSALRQVPVPGGLTLIVEVASFGDAEAGEFELSVQQTDLGSSLELLLLDGGFSLFIDAVLDANLLDVFAGEGPITIFVPSDEAFTAALDSMNLTQQDLLDQPGLLEDILLYHVVEGELLAEDLVELSGQALPTLLEGEEILISVTSENVVLNGEVNVVATDFVSGNGVIHIIDTILMPLTSDS